MYMHLTRKTHYKLSNLRRMIAKFILAGISEDLVHFEGIYSMKLEGYPSPCDGDRDMVQNTVKHVNEPRFFRETHVPTLFLKTVILYFVRHFWRPSPPSIKSLRPEANWLYYSQIFSYISKSTEGQS